MMETERGLDPENKVIKFHETLYFSYHLHYRKKKHVIVNLKKKFFTIPVCEICWGTNKAIKMSILPNQIVKFNSVPQLVLLCQQYIYVQIKHFFSNNFFIQKALTVGC